MKMPTLAGKNEHLFLRTTAESCFLIDLPKLLLLCLCLGSLLFTFFSKKGDLVNFKNISVGIQFNGKQCCQKQVNFCEK